VTARIVAQHFDQALTDLAQALAGTMRREELLTRLLGEAAVALAAESAFVGLLDGDVLQLHSVYGLPYHLVGTRYDAAGLKAAFAALETGEVIVGDEAASTAPAMAGHPALRSVLVMPLRQGGELIGALQFGYHEEGRRFSTLEATFAGKMAGLAAQTLENAHLFARMRRRAEFDGTLNEISSLVGSTFEVDATITTVLGLAAEAVGADLAFIRRRQRDRWVATHVWGMDSLPPLPVDVTTVAEQTRSLRAPVMLRRTDARRRNRQLMEQLGLGVLAGLPLLGKGEVYAALLFARREDEPFTEEELDFLGKTATAIAAAVTNARLYENERFVARTLQESFLHVIPEIPGLSLAADVSAAHRPDLVGGDFHDVLRLEDGRLAVLVGDVEGKGIRAAGLTETVRSALRVLLGAGHSPAHALGLVNTDLRLRDSDQFVTAFALVLDPLTGEADYSSAGHPPPVRVGGRAAHYLAAEGGVPLGTFPFEYAEQHVQLDEGDLLVFYTDGVTEARSEGELFGYDRLLAAVERAAVTSPADVVAQVRRDVDAFADEIRDDVQIVAVRFEGGQPDEAPASTLATQSSSSSGRRGSVR
jgi:serine phosphatase RsbU (regulator of sigma subunit)/putative methionine-R-sulfoxide reductase with GAF domain